MRKILWLMPSKIDCYSGVYKYNEELINLLKKKKNIEIKYVSRNEIVFTKYFNKFIIIPIFLIFYSNRYETLVFPEEGFAFLRIFSFSKYNKIIIHDFRKQFNSKHNINFKEKIKQIYLNFNFFFINFFSQIIVPSNFTKNLILNNFKDVKKKINILPNIINKKKSKTSKKILKIKKISKLYNIVLNLSSNEIRKNQKFICKIANISKKFKFVLVSKNKISPEYKNIINFNSLDQNELNQLYSLCNVYLDCSVFEGFGRSLIEAQSYGMPVICFKTKSNFEILSNTATYINSKISNKNLIRLINKNSKITKRQKGLIIKNAKRFNEKNILKKFKKTINEI